MRKECYWFLPTDATGIEVRLPTGTSIPVSTWWKQTLEIPPHSGSTDCWTTPLPLANSVAHLHSRPLSMTFFPHRQSLQPKDGGSIVLQNYGILPQHYTASQPREP